MTWWAGKRFGFVAVIAVLAVAGCGGATPVASVPTPPIDSDHAGPIQPTSASPDSGAKSVSAESYRTTGKTWPLTVDSGVLGCSLDGSAHLIFFKPDNPNHRPGLDHVYAVNGTARDLNKAAGAGWDIQSLWADDQTTSGLKVEMTDFMNDGLSLCP